MAFPDHLKDIGLPLCLQKAFQSGKVVLVRKLVEFYKNRHWEKMPTTDH